MGAHETLDSGDVSTVELRLRQLVQHGEPQ
jgi:hypothetical protein